jgi:hypothetical protein
MTVLERLKLELNNRDYFTDAEFSQLLSENSLLPEAEYIKKDMQKNLLYTVLDVLEAVANDTDIMNTMLTAEFQTIGQAYQWVEARIAQIKDKIAAIPETDDNFNPFSLMYTRTIRNFPGRGTVEAGVQTLTHSDIDYILHEDLPSV